MQATHAHCHDDKAKGAWFKNKTLMIIALMAMLVAASYISPFFQPLRHSLLMYVSLIWWAVLLGLVIGGAIEHFIPREFISYALSQSKKRTIIYSVFLGFLMSVCSHGILAIAIQIYKKGASVAAVMAFLLASPWANLPLTIILIGFFGAKALFFIFGAIGVAILSGFIFQGIESKGWIESNPHHLAVEKGFSLRSEIKTRFKGYKFSMHQLRSDVAGIYKGSVSLADMVLWWILLGVLISAIAAAYIPSNIFHDYMGPNPLGLFVTLGVATLLEVCSEGTAPLAFELYRQTGALGNAFVFLMAGVVTDYTEIGLIWINVGKKAALWLPLVTVPQVLVLGALANWIF
jgi:uncharacterized protein